MTVLLALALLAGPLIWEALHQRRLERERLARLEREQLLAHMRLLTLLFRDASQSFVLMSRAFGKVAALREAMDLATDR